MAGHSRPLPVTLPTGPLESQGCWVWGTPLSSGAPALPASRRARGCGPQGGIRNERRRCVPAAADVSAGPLA